MLKKSHASTAEDFPYLTETDVYLDSACQSLRPQPVIDAMQQYYTEFNSCGERVKYKWGREVDERVSATRAKILKMLKLSGKDYFVSFTLNTTYGINLLLDQLKIDGIKKVITSDIEHNSPFLSTITFAKKHGIPREILVRNDDGSIDLSTADFTDAVVVMNAVSNIDGRQMSNIKEVAAKVKKQGGIFIIDAAQTMSFYREMLQGIDADAICFSSHKMYGPSLGVMVVRRKLLDRIDSTFIGGMTVDDVRADTYDLSSRSPEHAHTAFEPGLQPYAEIIGLGAAIDFLSQNGHGQLSQFAQQIFDFLQSAPKIHLINQEPTTTISFYHENFDGHMLADALSDAGIMTRSGYFCCHYYLDKVKQYPPLVRMSLGLHNRASDIDRAAAVLAKIAR
ncbi:aminotransferase class V-fold PLP-dependent enzyme [Candidatus Saccharibacteria bacterium]|nr:aminotransferase class V-fold PLP-dependent enzyme [Candidatus Saccharibacteria bacterium]